MPTASQRPVVRTVAALAAALAFTPSQPAALGIRVPDQDPFATARGNAFAATADRPSAIYYNPAGITQLDGWQVSAGFYGIALSSEYTDPNGNVVETEDDPRAVPQLYATHRFKNTPFSAGLGVYSPFGLALEWPDNATFRAMRGRLSFATIHPVVAWEITPTLSVAAGPMFHYADASLRQTVFPVGQPFVPPSGGTVRFEGDGWDPSFDLALRWQASEKHAFGLHYRYQADMVFKGTSEVTEASVLSLPRQAASAELALPQQLVFGWSYRPTPRWNLEFNLDWTDWDRVNNLALRQATGDISVPLNWQSSLFYEFGVTRYFNEGWQVSAGYIYSENSIPSSNYWPLIPDSDRHVFSAGFGRDYGRFWWDFAYQFAYGPERRIGNAAPLVFPIGATANGDYEYISHAVSLAVGARF